MTTLKLSRGNEADLPTLAAGEPAFTLDTFKLFIGDGATNHEVGSITDVFTPVNKNAGFTVGAADRGTAFNCVGTFTVTKSGVKVIDGHVTLPELPGIGFEGKADLYAQMQALSD